MLHNTQLITSKDDSLKITTSLFVNRLSLPGFNLAGATLKATLMHGGERPGPDAEIFVEVFIPRIAVAATATPFPTDRFHPLAHLAPKPQPAPVPPKPVPPVPPAVPVVPKAVSA